MGWFNTDRAAVIVAALALLVSVAAVVVAIIYGNKQASIAAAAKDEARRSADAAEAQAAIAKEAREEARRSADAAERQVALAEAAREEARLAAAKMAHLEARRDHFQRATADIQLLRIESRPHARGLPHRELWAVVKNNGPRVYQYRLNVEFSTNNRTPARTGSIHAGETADLFLIRDGVRYSGIEALLDGECPCEQPDDERAHWRMFWPALIPVIPDDEPPSIW